MLESSPWARKNGDAIVRHWDLEVGRKPGHLVERKGHIQSLSYNENAIGHFERDSNVALVRT